MIAPAELRVLIDGLARRFENRVHNTKDEQAAANLSGWGQFLDDPTGQRQTGPYGTTVGIVVRALAQRGNDQLSERCGTRVNDWWHNRSKGPDGPKLFGQITRVAMLHLALRLAKIPNTMETLESIRQ